jgi:hypothetical protein
MQVVALHLWAFVHVRVAHDGAIGQHVLVLMSEIVGVHVFPVHVVVVVMTLVIVRMAVDRAIRVTVLVFVSRAFDLGFALAAATGRAHGVLPVA